MNITSQTLINQKIKHTKNLPFQSISSSSSRLRLNDAKRVLNETIKPFEIKTFKFEFTLDLPYHFEVKNVSFNMICCPSGIFTMGADDQDENPERIEQIKHPFLLGETEVTQELYKAVMGYNNPSRFNQNGGKKPVENVNWYEAVMFCNELSQMLRKRPYYHISDIKKRSNKIESANIQINENSNGFRLPTEKEWEYAAKAGTNNKYAGCDNERDLEKYGWYRANSNGSTLPVKTLLPNEWGFYDMSGNVGEWCWDKYDPDLAYRVDRGGSWYDSASDLRSAYRSNYSPGDRYGRLGFRVSASLVN